MPVGHVVSARAHAATSRSPGEHARVRHWQRSPTAQQCTPRHFCAVSASMLSLSVQLQPSDVGMHPNALQVHSRAGPGHAAGAQHRVRGYAATEHARSFVVPPTRHAQASPGERNDSVQRVTLAPTFA